MNRTGFTVKDADISACGTYRYKLIRALPATIGEPEPRRVNIIMLNPSTADASRDDPTIRRCTRFSADWGYGRLIVTNLFAFRATRPEDLKGAADPVGPENNRYIIDCASTSDLVVCAWGAYGDVRGRAREVLALLRAREIRPHALRATASGQPCHPLRLPGQLEPYEMR
jgi:hypothetical protein